MTIPQAIVTYVVCWWMVLFMVLPQGVEREENPGEGHVPSAPKNPNLRRKFKLTALLAIIPTVVIYLVASEARAEDTIYHATSHCKKLTKYMPSADLAVKDGEGAGGKRVKPANLEGGAVNTAFENVSIPLEIPAQKYLNPDKHNVDLSHSFIEAGKLGVSMDGEATLDGKSITETITGGCDDAE